MIAILKAEKVVQDTSFVKTSFYFHKTQTERERKEDGEMGLLAFLLLGNITSFLIMFQPSCSLCFQYSHPKAVWPPSPGPKQPRLEILELETAVELENYSAIVASDCSDIHFWSVELLNVCILPSICSFMTYYNLIVCSFRRSSPKHRRSNIPAGCMLLL